MTTIRFAAFALAAGAFVLPALAEDPPAAPAATSAPAAAPAPADATAPTPAAAPAPAAPTAPAAPAANMGRLYVSYPVQSNANYDANLAIDDLWVADPIKTGTCVYFDLPVGDHKLHATTTPVWRVSLAAGESKYADLKFRGGSINGLAPTGGSAPADLTACKQSTSPL